jgi:glutathione S-transferase
MRRQLDARRTELERRFAQVETVLGDGPHFAGDRFSIVDAAYGPVFRYFDAFDRITRLGVFDHTPKLRYWREALAMRPSVSGAVDAQYPKRLMGFLHARGSALSRRIEAVTA